MVIHVKCNSEAFKTESNVHYMPCKIKLDGNATVSKYLEPYIRSGHSVLTFSFRGHPLNGKELNLPKGCKGLLLLEKRKPFSEDADWNLSMVNTFKTITYWNWDKVSRNDDVFIAAMDWVIIGKELHSRVADK